MLVSVLPKTIHTENVVDTNALQRLRRGSILINIGRGNAIDDDALLIALNSGAVGAAVLDVFREEPLSKVTSLLATTKRLHHLSYISSDTRTVRCAGNGAQLEAFHCGTGLDRHI